MGMIPMLSLHGLTYHVRPLDNQHRNTLTHNNIEIEIVIMPDPLLPCGDLLLLSRWYPKSSLHGHVCPIRPSNNRSRVFPPMGLTILHNHLKKHAKDINKIHTHITSNMNKASTSHWIENMANLHSFTSPSHHKYFLYPRSKDLLHC